MKHTLAIFLYKANTLKHVRRRFGTVRLVPETANILVQHFV